MKHYLITYDLNRPGQYYNDLFEAIKRTGRAYHVLQNAWITYSTMTSVQIRDQLKLKVDANDELFVCEVGSWASFNMPEVANWLNGK